MTFGHWNLVVRLFQYHSQLRKFYWCISRTSTHKLFLESVCTIEPQLYNPHSARLLHNHSQTTAFLSHSRRSYLFHVRFWIHGILNLLQIVLQSSYLLQTFCTISWVKLHYFSYHLPLPLAPFLTHIYLPQKHSWNPSQDPTINLPLMHLEVGLLIVHKSALRICFPSSGTLSHVFPGQFLNLSPAAYLGHSVLTCSFYHYCRSSIFSTILISARPLCQPRCVS